MAPILCRISKHQLLTPWLPRLTVDVVGVVVEAWIEASKPSGMRQTPKASVMRLFAPHMR